MVCLVDFSGACASCVLCIIDVQGLCVAIQCVLRYSSTGYPINAEIRASHNFPWDVNYFILRFGGFGVNLAWGGRVFWRDGPHVTRGTVGVHVSLCCSFVASQPSVYKVTRLVLVNSLC